MPSRSTKIGLLLAVDVIFFFIELIVGYAVGSLALVADSFHMLNDVMSLIVALYAIKLSKSEASPQYSYGWHRAEIVAALVNGVFLLALCFSIFMEAIERFFSTPEISNAKLVVIVGTLGLASNILGLFLFHEHSHTDGDTKSEANQKLVESRTEIHPPVANGFTEPQAVPRTRNDSFTNLYGHPAATRASVMQAAQDIGYGKPMSPSTQSKFSSNVGHERSSSLSSHPGERARSLRRRGDVLIDIAEGGSDPNSRLEYDDQAVEDTPDADHATRDVEATQNSHGKHKANDADGSHGSMNMRALILHVVGDALGNVGVIATGLVIWLSTWKYKFYFDPVISLVITVIIFSSALPLVRSASFILLQAAPSTISLEDVREDIQRVDGVLSVHELHVWQLSENKVVASVHVWLSRRREYMHIAHNIRRILHDYGVHSCTIQPEFHNVDGIMPEEQLITNQETHCLIPCPPGQECKPDNACCPPQRPPTPPLVDV